MYAVIMTKVAFTLTDQFEMEFTDNSNCDVRKPRYNSRAHVHKLSPRIGML